MIVAVEVVLFRGLYAGEGIVEGGVAPDVMFWIRSLILWMLNYLIRNACCSRRSWLGIVQSFCWVDDLFEGIVGNVGYEAIGRSFICRIRASIVANAVANSSGSILSSLDS